MAAGEAVGIIGPNGAGKSTLFSSHHRRSLRPDAKAASSFDGADITPDAGRRRDAVAAASAGRYQVPQPFEKHDGASKTFSSAAYFAGRGIRERAARPMHCDARCCERTGLARQGQSVLRRHAHPARTQAAGTRARAWPSPAAASPARRDRGWPDRPVNAAALAGHHPRHPCRGPSPRSSGSSMSLHALLPAMQPPPRPQLRPADGGCERRRSVMADRPQIRALYLGLDGVTALVEGGHSGDAVPRRLLWRLPGVVRGHDARAPRRRVDPGHDRMPMAPARSTLLKRADRRRSARGPAEAVLLPMAGPHRRAAHGARHPEAQGIAMVPEGRKLFPSLTVEENLTGRRLCRTQRPGPTGRCGARLCALFPILAERRAPARRRRLSGGQQQMVAIGRALMANPDACSSATRSRLGLAPAVIRRYLRGYAGHSRGVAPASSSSNRISARALMRRERPCSYCLQRGAGGAGGQRRHRSRRAAIAQRLFRHDGARRLIGGRRHPGAGRCCVGGFYALFADRAVAHVRGHAASSTSPMATSSCWPPS